MLVRAVLVLGLCFKGLWPVLRYGIHGLRAFSSKSLIAGFSFASVRPVLLLDVSGSRVASGRSNVVVSSVWRGLGSIRCHHNEACANDRD